MKRVFFLILPAMMSVVSCTSRMSRSLADVESYIQERPDSALVVLEAMDRAALVRDTDKARFSLLYAMALDKNFIDTTDVSIIAPAVDYYRRHGSPDEKLKALYYQGRLYDNSGNPLQTMTSYTEACDWVDMANDDKAAGLLFRAIAGQMINNFNDEEAILYLDRAIERHASGGFADYATEALFQKALAFANMDNWAEVNRIIGELEANGYQDVNYCRAQALKASSLYYTQTKDYRSIVDIYTNLVQNGEQLEYSDYALYGFALFMIGSVDYSDAIFNCLKEEIDGDVTEAIYSNWEALRLQEKGEWEEAYNLYKTALYKQDREVQSVLKQAVSKAQRDYYSSQSELSKLTLSNQRKGLVILFVSLAFLVLLIIFVSIKNSREAQLREYKIHELAELVQNQTEEGKHQEEEARIRFESLRSKYALMYHDQFSKISNLCEAYFGAETQEKKRRDVYEAALKIMKDIGKDSKGQSGFERMIDNSLDNLMTRFRVDFPGMSVQDYRLVSFVFAGMSDYAIKLILDAPSMGAVYTRKTRIKHKISSSNSENRKDYLLYFS